MSNKHTEAMLNSQWFVVVDDLVGGWVISTIDKPLSETYFREESVYIVGEMLSKDIAEYVVSLHEQRRMS